uniref:Arogenate dehydratase n=1 Tax=Physcomitrium patens TaxID=3218 RepID=A0A7I4BHR2_PHYPA
MALKICPGDKLLRIESFPIVGNAPNGKKTLGWLGTATRIVLQRTSDNKKALSCRAAASSSWPASNAFLQKVTQNGASRKEDKSEPEHGLTQFQEVLDTQAASNGTTLEVSTSQMGVPGAYSEAAAAKAYPRCEAVPCEQFEAAFSAVELWLVDRAVLPVENSLGGSIHRNYDLLLRHRLHIVGEVQLGIHHCLMGIPGVKKEELQRVVSHPQALAQCEQTLTKLGVTREAVDDTAGAAQFIAAHNLRDTGAVASARAAEIYGLEILMDGIQDDLDNVTRFLMLAREPVMPRTDRKFKTSIVFTLEEGPGVLFKALSVFALRDINLTKIESRPQRKRPLRVVDDSNNGSAKYFDYLFYIDFEASMADVRAQNALGHLQEFATFLRVLGSYPMDMSPMRA